MITQVLFEGLVTRYVRVIPQDWRGLSCVRIELYGTSGTYDQTPWMPLYETGLSYYYEALLWGIIIIIIIIIVVVVVVVIVYNISIEILNAF